MESKEKDYVDFVFLLPGESFSLSFLLSWTTTIQYLNTLNFTYKFASFYSPVISRIRNKLLGNFYGDLTSDLIHTTLFNGKLRCKKVIFLDSDMVWTEEDIHKLLFTDVDVLTGIYSANDRKTVTVSVDGETRLSYKDVTSKNTLFEVFDCGLGFFACSFDVLNSLTFPWFDTPVTNLTYNSETYGFVDGEDNYFCNKLREKGYKIYADPTMLVGHEKQTILEVPKNV